MCESDSGGNRMPDGTTNSGPDRFSQKNQQVPANLETKYSADAGMKLSGTSWPSVR